MAQQTMQTDDQSSPTSSTDLVFRSPELRDGGGMWRVARDSQTLDLNSSYTYLLFARDFAATSRVAVQDGAVVGFVIGYLRPEAGDRLFVWQIAVDESQRGKGVAARLLDALLSDLSQVRHLETTITEDNAASQRLFASLAQRHSADHTIEPLMAADDFPDDHDAEHLHVIGALNSRA